MDSCLTVIFRIACSLLMLHLIEGFSSIEEEVARHGGIRTLSDYFHHRLGVQASQDGGGKTTTCVLSQLKETSIVANQQHTLETQRSLFHLIRPAQAFFISPDSLPKLFGGKAPNSNKEQRNNIDNNDFYALLNVYRSATDAEIKKAFRKLTREIHPDVNSAPEAKEEYARILRAYGILSDPEKRSTFDRFGIITGEKNQVGTGSSAAPGDSSHGGRPASSGMSNFRHSYHQHTKQQQQQRPTQRLESETPTLTPEMFRRQVLKYTGQKLTIIQVYHDDHYGCRKFSPHWELITTTGNTMAQTATPHTMKLRDMARFYRLDAKRDDDVLRQFLAAGGYPEDGSSIENLPTLFVAMNTRRHAVVTNAETQLDNLWVWVSGSLGGGHQSSSLSGNAGGGSSKKTNKTTSTINEVDTTTTNPQKTSRNRKSQQNQFQFEMYPMRDFPVIIDRLIRNQINPNELQQHITTWAFEFLIHYERRLLLGSTSGSSSRQRMLATGDLEIGTDNANDHDVESLLLFDESKTNTNQQQPPHRMGRGGGDSTKPTPGALIMKGINKASRVWNQLFYPVSSIDLTDRSSRMQLFHGRSLTSPIVHQDEYIQALWGQRYGRPVAIIGVNEDEFQLVDNNATYANGGGGGVSSLRAWLSSLWPARRQKIPKTATKNQSTHHKATTQQPEQTVTIKTKKYRPIPTFSIKANQAAAEAAMRLGLQFSSKEEGHLKLLFVSSRVLHSIFSECSDRERSRGSKLDPNNKQQHYQYHKNQHPPGFNALWLQLPVTYHSSSRSSGRNKRKKIKSSSSSAFKEEEEEEGFHFDVCPPTIVTTPSTSTSTTTSQHQQTQTQTPTSGSGLTHRHPVYKLTDIDDAITFVSKRFAESYIGRRHLAQRMRRIIKPEYNKMHASLTSYRMALADVSAAGRRVPVLHDVESVVSLCRGWTGHHYRNDDFRNGADDTDTADDDDDEEEKNDIKTKTEIGQNNLLKEVCLLHVIFEPDRDDNSVDHDINNINKVEALPEPMRHTTAIHRIIQGFSKEFNSRDNNGEKTSGGSGSGSSRTAGSTSSISSKKLIIAEGILDASTFHQMHLDDDTSDDDDEIPRRVTSVGRDSRAISAGGMMPQSAVNYDDEKHLFLMLTKSKTSSSAQSNAISITKRHLMLALPQQQRSEDNDDSAAIVDGFVRMQLRKFLLDGIKDEEEDETVKGDTRQDSSTHATETEREKGNVGSSSPTNNKRGAKASTTSSRGGGGGTSFAAVITDGLDLSGSRGVMGGDDGDGFYISFGHWAPLRLRFFWTCSIHSLPLGHLSALLAVLFLRWMCKPRGGRTTATA